MLRILAGCVVLSFLAACVPAAMQPTASPTATATPAVPSPSATASASPAPSEQPSNQPPSPSPQPTALPTPVPTPIPSLSASPSASPSNSQAFTSLVVNLNAEGFGLLPDYAVRLELKNASQQLIASRTFLPADNLSQLSISSQQLTAGETYTLEVSGADSASCLRTLRFRYTGNAPATAGTSASAELSSSDFKSQGPVNPCVETFELSGTVSDAENQPLSARLKVQLIEPSLPEYQRIFDTGPDGKYSLSNLPINGTLILEAQAEGQTVKRTYIPLQDEANQKLDIRLETSK